MINTKKEAIVGAFVLLSLTIFIIGIFSFGKMSIKGNYYTLRAVFSDVNNLSLGSPVIVGGVKIGRVNKIYLEGDKVIVEMLIKKGIKVSKKARISVILKGVIGDMIVSIYNPDNAEEEYKEGDIIVGEEPMNMGTFFKKANEFIEKAEETISILEKSGVTDNLNETLKSSKRLLDDTDKLVNNLNNNVVKNINESIKRVDSVLAKIEEAIPEKERVDGIITRVENGIGNMEKGFNDRNKDIEETLKSLNELLKSVDNLIKEANGVVNVNKDKIAVTLEHFEKVSQETLDLVEGIDKNSINDSIKNINDITKDVKEIIKDVKESVDGIDTTSLKKSIKNTEKLSKGLDRIIDTKLNFYPELEVSTEYDVRSNFNFEIYNRPTNLFLYTGKNDINDNWGRWNIVAGKRIDKFKVGIGVVNDKAGVAASYEPIKSLSLGVKYYDLKKNNGEVSADYWIKDFKLYLKYDTDELYGGIGYRF